MAFVGSCQDMCPESERQARFGLYMSIFEKNQYNQPDEYAMVKEYRRSGADQEEPSANDLRTVDALELTMNHLVKKIMDDPRSKQQDTAIEWYDFLWDRLRALRKDITQQNICDYRTALLVERCARFHVHSCYALNRIKDFDVDMNKRNLNDCLQMLRQMYSDLRTTSGIICPGEMEFQKYDILLHLNDDQLSSTILMKTSDHRCSDEMKFIFKIFSAYTNNDFYKFLQLMEQADYMTSCILSLYANQMRLLGLKTIAHACSAARQVTLFPIETAIDCLRFDSPDDLKSFAATVGIGLQIKDDKEYLSLSKDLVVTIRNLEENTEPIKSFRLIENKMHEHSVGRLVYGNDSILTIEVPRPQEDSSAPMDAELSRDTIKSQTNWFQTQQSIATTPITSITNTPMSNFGWSISNSFTSFTKPPPIEHEQSEIHSSFGGVFSAPNISASGMAKPNLKFSENKMQNSTFSFSIANNFNPPRSEPDSSQLNETPLELASQISNRSQDSNRSSIIKISSLQEETRSNDEIVDSSLDKYSTSSTEAYIEQQTISAPVNGEIIDTLRHLEQQVVALDEQVQQNYEETYIENVEPELNEFLARAIKRRANLTKDQLAELMPAGRIQIASLASKRPTLKLPNDHTIEQVEAPTKRRKSHVPRETLESINTSIQDEVKVNKIFQELASMITQ